VVVTMPALRAASLGALAACFAAAVAALAPLSASGTGRVTSGRYLRLADALAAELPLVRVLHRSCKEGLRRTSDVLAGDL